MNIYKEIYKTIKSFDKIVIARHLGVDPDAMASSLALKQIILNTFPNKKVYAVGVPTSRFKYMGTLDKINDEIAKDALLIVLDTPDKRRVDIENIDNFKSSIKIDHHPFVEKFCDIEYFNEDASSTCEIILDMIYNTKLILDKKSAELLFQGIVSDTNRFTTINTSYKTFDLVHRLIKDTNINFTSLYDNLYMRPMSEIRLQGYISQNLTVTENGLAYIKLTNDIIKELGVDSASAGNMINNFNYIDEVIVWAFISEDVKNNIIKVTMRSRGPIINTIASKHNGGGHERASGARVTTFEEVDILLDELDNVCKEYRSVKNENN